LCQIKVNTRSLAVAGGGTAFRDAGNFTKSFKVTRGHSKLHG